MAGFLSSALNTEQWMGDPSEVFSEKEVSFSSNTASISTTFKTVTRVYKNFVRSWWEVQSLDTYIKHKIVPRGLRNHIIPAARLRSPDFIKKWEKESIESSLRLMGLLLEEEKTVLSGIETELKEVIEQTKKFNTHPEYSNKEVYLQSIVEKYTAQLKEKKHSLFNRDIKDFKEGRIFDYSIKHADALELDTEASSSECETDPEQSSIRGRGTPYPRRSRGSGRRGRRGRGYTGGRGGFLDNTPPASQYMLRKKD